MTSRTSSSPRGGSVGFTLMEMLIVLALLGILMGISIGAFRKSVPRRDVARNAVIDALHRAKLFATAENAPSTVRLEPPAVVDEGWPTVTALGRETVAQWHLESTALEGWPLAAHGGGLEEEPRGAIAKAIALSDTDPSWIDFGVLPSFDSEDGFALEFFAKVPRTRSQTLFAKGKGFTLRSEPDGALTMQVRVVGKDEKGDPKTAHQTLSSAQPVLVANRWVKVVVSYDGVDLRIVGDDGVAASFLVAQRTPFAPDRAAPLLCGTDDAPAGFALDEVKWGVFAAETQELRDMELGNGAQEVHFGPDGSLDPRFHQDAVELLLVTPKSPTAADPQKRGVETVIRVGMLGDVH